LKNQQDGGEVLLDAFRDLAIEYVVCSAGSEWPPLWEALARQRRDGLDGPKYLDCGHETLAVTIAAAYTQITGKMQAVLLHAGAGLSQGSMAVGAARALETPMLVMSGETTAYGETEFDPGSQWYRNLSVVGGPQRLIEPVTKWAQQVPSFETLYHSVLRAGELAQRAPKGPTYLCVSMETLLESRAEPSTRRLVPPGPKLRPGADSLETVANLIANAKRPVLSVLTVGPDREAFEALVELAELAAMPVFEGAGAFFGNFPKTHDLYLGTDLKPHLQDCDLVLLVDNATPWYPPSRSPKDIPVVAIGESPLKSHLVYQNLGATHYLEGDVATTLRLLSDAVRRASRRERDVVERRAHWKKHHEAWRSKIAQAEERAAAKETITVPFLVNTLRRLLPAQTSYVDETIVHMKDLRDHLMWDDPHTFFRSPSGLGQGLGYALGVKLALPERLVVMTIGDGTFMYNPTIPALAFADEHRLPLLIVILNNLKYGVMEELHNRFYPEGTAQSRKDYYGVNLHDVAYERVATMIDGYCRRVENKSELEEAIAEALKSVQAGKTAVLNVMMPETVAF